MFFFPKRCAKIVGETLRHFDGKASRADRIGVMSITFTHFLLKAGTAAGKLIRSWENITADKLIRRSAVREVLATDYFDRLVRDEAILQTAYVTRRNPEKARLGEAEYLLRKANSQHDR